MTTDLFSSRGEAAALMRELDWSANPLGPPEKWPQSLRTIIPIMLASRFAMRVLWGPEFIFLYNDSYRPVLGASKHPWAMGSRTRESFAEVWNIVGPMFERVRTGEAFSLEDTLLPLERNGYLEECYFTLSYSPLADDHGAIEGVLGVVYETTKRCLAERRLRTLRDLSGGTPATTVIAACSVIAAALAKNPHDVPFALLYVVSADGASAKLVQTVGVERTSPLAIGSIALDGVASTDSKWPFGRGRRVVALGTTFGDVRAGAYPEAITSAIVTPLFAPGGAAPCAYVLTGVNPRCALDETYETFFALAAEQMASSIANALFDEERSRLVLRERAAEDRLRQLFNDAPAAIAVIRGPDHVFELANPLYCEIVGRTALVGRAGREAIPELEAQGIWSIFDRVYATGEPFVGREFPVKLARNGGRALDEGFFNFSAQPMRDVDGTILGVMIFAIEITEQVVARRAEADARAHAERSNVAKDEFLAIVSHELRNPLSAILGWTRMLRTSELPPQRHEQALETIERNAVNQSQLIEDLLDVSRIVSGKLRLDVRPMSFVEVVRAAIDSARPAIEARQLRIRVTLDDSPASLMGDAARLQQVVWNLLTNATKFTPKGGSITVVLTRVDSTLELTVADTGQGISPDFLPHVFERFKQADSSTTRKHGGLGLGLAIAKNLVEMHGGTVIARSEGEGKGTTFIVRLPVAPMRAAAAVRLMVEKGQALDCPPELRDLHVLVVEDDDDGREMVGLLLEQCRARVTPAASVKEAIVAFERERPDVVLTDVGMPDADGYELVKYIRGLKPADGGDTPVASLTAYAGAEDRRRALRAGFNMHVSKPVDPAELVAVIASLGRFARALR